MSYYIILRGPLGVGKSTLAQELAQVLNGKHVSIDNVLKENGLDAVDQKEGCIPAKNFIKADQLILPEVKKELKKGKIIVFDGCFYHQEHVEHLIKNLHYPYYIFTLKAPLEVCIKRDSKRKKTHGKDAAAAVHQLVSKFDAGMIIDTKSKDIKQIIKTILNRLASTY